MGVSTGENGKITRAWTSQKEAIEPGNELPSDWCLAQPWRLTQPMSWHGGMDGYEAIVELTRLLVIWSLPHDLQLTRGWQSPSVITDRRGIVEPSRAR